MAERTPFEVVMRNAEDSGWMHFRDPVEVFSTSDPADVVPTLRRVEDAVESQGLSAAGFVGYEAAPSFDPALSVRRSSGFPLVWFMVSRTVEKMSAVQVDSAQEDTGVGPWAASVSDEEYCGAIKRIKEHIAEGETYQVNFSYRLRSSFRGDPLAFFRRLTRAQRARYGAYVDTGRFVVCSASPELFFRLDGRVLLSRPMKGTAPRGLTLREDAQQAAWLHSSGKNRAENVMIVDMVRNDVGRVAVGGTVNTAELFTIEKYPTLWQMTSTVQAETDAGSVDILSALFPAASITGAPKIRTMSIIKELESSPRRIYTGAVGYILPGRRTLFNVAIRTVLIDREAGTAEYGVGGGIVWNSTERSELNESRTKSLILTDPAPEFSLLETMLWTPEGGYAFLELHIARLLDSAVYFSFATTSERVRKELGEFADHLERLPHKVRMLAAEDGTMSIEAEIVDLQPANTRPLVRLAASPVDSTNRFLYHKTTHRAVYEEARAGFADCEDVLLWNERGELTESTIANLVLEIEGEFVTPPVASGLLPGVYREWMIRGGSVKECVITRSDLDRATRILLVNSVRGARDVRFETQ